MCGARHCFENLRASVRVAFEDFYERDRGEDEGSRGSFGIRVRGLFSAGFGSGSRGCLRGEGGTGYGGWSLVNIWLWILAARN